MRIFIAILVLIFVGCNSNKNNQFPSKFNQILEKKTFTVVVTYSVDCPVSQLYTSVLKDISASLPKDSFQCILLKVNAQENWDIDMPGFLVIDTGALDIAKGIRMEVFPEVAIVNSSGIIFYKGAIDGRVKEIGNTHFKPLPNEMYLNNALTQLRKKQQISKPLTNAKGCFIEYNKNP
jgi:hypothetical protein